MPRVTIEAPAVMVAGFAAHVAHDLNNILTGILGNLEMLQYRLSGAGDAKLSGYIDTACHAGGRAVTFTRRLQAFSGQGAASHEAVPVERLLRDTLATMHLAERVTLRDETGGAATLLCHPCHAELALRELLQNAMEAVAQSGDIVLSTAIRPDNRIAIEVRDSGHGMAADILARAGDLFFTTRQGGSGSGLGLAIAACFAQQAGGTLTLESAPGAGCTALLLLPRG